MISNETIPKSAVTDDCNNVVNFLVNSLVIEPTYDGCIDNITPSELEKYNEKYKINEDPKLLKGRPLKHAKVWDTRKTDVTISFH